MQNEALLLPLHQASVLNIPLTNYMHSHICRHTTFCPIFSLVMSLAWDALKAFFEGGAEEGGGKRGGEEGGGWEEQHVCLYA